MGGRGPNGVNIGALLKDDMGGGGMGNGGGTGIAIGSGCDLDGAGSTRSAEDDAL